jgi:ankyrin repeat protein
MPQTLAISRRSGPCSHGRLDVATLLLDRGAEVDARDYTERTPLILATTAGRLKVVELLLARGADPNAQQMQKSEGALDGAARSNRTDIAELLPKNGADPNARDSFGDTPLAIATYRCHLDVVALLAANGADLQARNNAGWSFADFVTPDYCSSEAEVEQLRRMIGAQK